MLVHEKEFKTKSGKIIKVNRKQYFGKDGKKIPQVKYLQYLAQGGLERE